MWITFNVQIVKMNSSHHSGATVCFCKMVPTPYSSIDELPYERILKKVADKYIYCCGSVCYSIVIYGAQGGSSC